jgi:hypothetical protein
MPGVQYVGNVRRGDYDDVRIFAVGLHGPGLNVEIPGLTPGTVERLFDGLWI